MIIVTGPALTSSRSIVAPNSPVSTRPGARSFRRATNRSYRGTATSGGAAPTKLGPATLAHVPVERELAHHQQPSPYLVE